MPLLKKTSRLKPFFRNFLSVRANVQNRRKLLSFYKKKWQPLKNKYKKKLKFFKKYKVRDQGKYLVSRFARKNTEYRKKSYKKTFIAIKAFKIFYGILLKKQLKKEVAFAQKILKKQQTVGVFLALLKQFESRLDTVLIRARLCPTLPLARQIIKHGKVRVNTRTIKNKNYLLKPGDTVKIEEKFARTLQHPRVKAAPVTPLRHEVGVQKTSLPHPPSHMTVNYKIFQIVFGKVQCPAFSNFFFF